MKRIFLVRMITLASLLGLVGQSFAQGTKRTQAPAAAKSISEYMRRVGLLYLETAGDLSLSCRQSSDSDCMGNWETRMNGLEDRIEITLSEPHRAAGDTPLFDLLRTARYVRQMYVQADHDQQKLWADAWITCDAETHSMAVVGTFTKAGADQCEEKIKAATAQGATKD